AERGLFGSGDRGMMARIPGGADVEIFPTSADGDRFFSLFPFPNNPRGPYGANTYTEQLPASADGAIFSTKLDQNFEAFRKSHRFTSRYNFTDDATTLPVTGEALFSSLRALVRAQNLSLFLNSTLSTALSNEARFSYGRTRLGFNEVRNPFLRPSNKFPDAPFLLNAPTLSNATLPSGNPGYVSLGGLTEDRTGPIGQVIVSGYSPIGVDVYNFPQRRVNNTFQYADTLIYNLSKHHLTGGLDLRRVQLNSALDRNFRPIAVFGGTLDVAPFPQFNVNNQFIPNQKGFYLGSEFIALGSPTGFSQTLASASVA